MRDYFYFFAIILLLLSSCTNKINHSQAKSIIEIDTTIANYQNFYYDLGELKNNEGAGINVKPKYSKISEVFTDSIIGTVIFKYKAQDNYDGKDFVELYKSSSLEKGDTIRINFTIAN